MKRRRLVSLLCRMLGVTLVFSNVATSSLMAFATPVAAEERIEETDSQEEIEIALEANGFEDSDEEEEEESEDGESEDKKSVDENLEDEDLDEEELEKEEKKVTDGEYNNNIGDLTYAGDGTWEVTEDGLLSDAMGKGDCFAFSKTKGKNFVYSTEVKFLENQGAAALLFRSNGTADDKESYVVNIDGNSHRCKFFRWQRNDALQLIDEKPVTPAEDETYTLKVVAIDSWILYFVNDELVASRGDYYMQPGDLGQDTYIGDGVFGLLNWNGKVVYQNTYYRAINSGFTPLLENIKVTSDEGTVGKAARFVSTEPMMLQYVDNDASEINIQVEKVNEDAVIEVRDEDGNVYEGGKNIPVKTGANYISIKSTVTDEEGYEASAVYRVNVHRYKQDVEYYNEVYRDQYHYSVKEGWANDPNGLVYYNGRYHMFYQFFDDIKWGPMHWAHATSEDLLHWEEEPIAFYPDANGAMFSGCIVADTNNTSGLFDSEDGGLVALITADGNGQRIKVAYSQDEGKTWKKLDKVAADWSNDPLHSRDFRDPKVFRWENKWFMVVAGGPLRIYSSDNLTEWKCESTYADLHTECPDMYPVVASDGTLKWVLSRGGRLYKVGDFIKVDEKWTFVPDEEYKDRDGIMNFGKDSYAAMTYYVQDFGTEENPEIPEILELNWMNTWDDYCNSVAEKTGQDFNGTFNLNLKLGLIKEGETYLLTQSPADEYKKLRDKSEALKLKNEKITGTSDILDDFKGNTYEICATFKPDKDTSKVGFKLRKGNEQETVVAYDIEKQQVYIDRSKSGIILSGKFSEVSSQYAKMNDDGTIDLHIYVDRASVEVFTAEDTVCGAAQIFANPFSLGTEVFAEGGTAKANIDIYPIKSIWRDKKTTDEIYAINSLFPKTSMMNCGDEVKIDAYILPVGADQSIEWSLKSGEGIVDLSDNGKITALKKGSAVVVATSKANPDLTREFKIEVYEDNFKTNIKEFVNLNGNWSVDDETLIVSNVSQNDYYMTKEKIQGDYTWKTKIKFKKGLINLFLCSEHLNPLDESGAYSIQFAPDNTAIRLFPFGRDDIYRGQLKAPIGDGKYHDIEIQKKDTTFIVYVDGENSLEYTFEDVDLSEGYIGLGLWDGQLETRTFYVNYAEDEKEETGESTKEEPAKEETSDAQDEDKANSDEPKKEPSNSNQSTGASQNTKSSSDGATSNAGTSAGSASTPAGGQTGSARIQSPVETNIAAPQVPLAGAAQKPAVKPSKKNTSETVMTERDETEEVAETAVVEAPSTEEISDEKIPKSISDVEDEVITDTNSTVAAANNIFLKIFMFVAGVAVSLGIVGLVVRKVRK